MIRVATLLLLCALHACSAPEPPLRVGLLAWPPYELARLAEQLGYYDPDAIELVEFQSPAEAWRAYTVGGLDAVALTMDFAIKLHSIDMEHRVFLVIDESLGGDAALSHEPMSALGALRGKRIGVESGPLGAHMLRRMLELADLSPADINLEFIDIPDQHAAFASRRVDVLITYEPLRSKLIAGGASEVFSSRDIPGEIVDVFIARAAGIERRIDDFGAFTEGWFRALDALRSDPLACAELIAPRLGMSAREFLDALAGVRLLSRDANRRLLTGTDDAFLAGVQRLSATTSSLTQAMPSRDLRDLRDLFTARALMASGQ